MWKTGSSAPPCACIRPEQAWKIGSKPGRVASGPDEPQPVIEVWTRSGFTSWSVSQPRPSRSISPAREVEEDLAPLGALQIEHQRALAAVPADEAEGRHAERIAVGRLDLEHLGAEVGEQHGAEGAGDEARQVEDTDALEARAR